MAEPFAKPTELNINKAIEIYGDPLIYSLVNGVIRGLNKLSKESLPEYSEVHKRELIRMMRVYIYWVGWDSFQECLGEAIAQASDEFYKNFELPPMDYYFSKKQSTIKSNANIFQVAVKYGLEIKNKRAVCPFHADSSPSLQFYPKTNSFYCFGCNTGGDVITFVQKMEELRE